jgi:hypothetical protein
MVTTQGEQISAMNLRDMQLQQILSIFWGMASLQQMSTELDSIKQKN